MTLKELLEQVKEENLSREQLESYRDKLVGLASDIQLQLADFLKKKAIFMLGKKDGQSVADRKIEWDGSNDGLRLIELKNYSTAVKIQLKNLRDRIFQVI